MSTDEPELLDMGNDAEFVEAFRAYAEQTAEDLRIMTNILALRGASGRGPDMSELALQCLRTADLMRFIAREVLTPVLGVRELQGTAERELPPLADFVRFREKRMVARILGSTNVTREPQEKKGPRRSEQMGRK